MHDLSIRERRTIANRSAAGLHRAAKSSVGQAKNVFEEAMDDLSEVAFLLKDLSDTVGDVNHAPQSWLLHDFAQYCDNLKARHSRCVDLIERARRWGNSTELQALLLSIRKEYTMLKSVLRVAYRQRGAVLCGGDWQSPVYAASIDTGFNRLNEGIAEHVLDYKRDGHLDAVQYEQAFVSEYASHLGSQQINAYLANSGMAAFSTVLHWLAHESDIETASVVAVQPMYFENVHLAGAFFPGMTRLQAPDGEALLACLRSQQPSIVLCDAVTNCGEVIAQDWQVILDWAKSEAEHRVAIVLDTTCFPLPLLPTGLLRNVPENVSVFFVESLAKHHQFGMDATTGGVVVAHTDTRSHTNFAKARARFGMNISDASVGSLPRPQLERLTQRMRRHARNIRLLATGLQSGAAWNNGVMESLSWLQDGTAEESWFHGSCLTIKFRKAFRSIAFYKQFEQKVLELCKERSHPIVFGTSFGFDITRLYVTAPSTRFEDPFLRVSIGTETKAEIQTLVDIMLAASSSLKASAPALPVEQPSPTPMPATTTRLPGSEPVPTAPVEFQKPGLRSSVYLGEQGEGLKNYLSPANYPATPLVELPPDLNPFHTMGVRIMAKIMPLVPLMNIKSIPAFSMLNKASERGELAGVERIIESSSSNTVLSLSVLGKLFGIDTTCAIVDHNIAPSLTRMLRLFGIEIFMHPAAGHELFGKMAPRSERAWNIGNEEGWLNPGQYTNPDNPEGFARWLAPDLFKQTDGKLALLACALGTCGTMVGVSRGLRERKPDMQVVACCPVAGQAVPGPREKSLLKDVSFPWQDVANATVELTSKESFSASIKLLRRGILGGPSSGMNYAGLLHYLQQEKESGRLEESVKANGGEMWCVFLCCDSPLPHVDEYYDELGDNYFPEIHPVPALEHNDDSFGANDHAFGVNDHAFGAPASCRHEQTEEAAKMATLQAEF
jgi:cysteine synthase/cystathionine beta-lyase/cystathionine gamma-synthase